VVGSWLVSRGKVEVSKEYSFSSIGSKRVFSKSMQDSVKIELTDLTPNQVKILIRGIETNSWFDILPITSTRVNPDVYGPLLRIDIITDSVCSLIPKTNLSIDTNHLDSTEIKYVDYLCSDNQDIHIFGSVSAGNDANLSPKTLPWRFNSLSRDEFSLGDTLTIYGEFLDNPDLEITMRCYGTDKEFNFTKILKVPRENIIENTCELITFIVPYEISYEKSGFPKKMYPISGFIRPKSYLDGLEYEIIK
jgi:hypothetical protein